MSELKVSKASKRKQLLKAAEELMVESGYAAVTSRRVAEKAGLKPQLVHYYFKTMDDLFVAVYRQFAGRLLEKQQLIKRSRRPLRDIWAVATEAQGVLLTEFVALANHRKSIQSEITDFGLQYRHTQIEIMEKIFGTEPLKEFPWSATFAALFINSLARSLAVEDEFTITEGHQDALTVIDKLIAQYDNKK